MLDSTATTPATTRHCTADAAQLPEALTGIARTPAPAPHAWSIECTEFTPAIRPGDVLGFIRLLLPGGMMLNDLRIVRLQDGSIGVVLPRRAVLARRQPVRRPDGEFMTVCPIDFPRRADWERFNTAALKAIRTAFPDALPNVTLNSETRCAPTVAAATQGSD